MNTEQIIDRINTRVQELSEDDSDMIVYYLSYHSCEPMAAAERISEYLKCDYNAILDLL